MRMKGRPCPKADCVEMRKDTGSGEDNWGITYSAEPVFLEFSLRLYFCMAFSPFLPHSAHFLTGLSWEPFLNSNFPLKFAPRETNL